MVGMGRARSPSQQDVLNHGLTVMFSLGMKLVQALAIVATTNSSFFYIDFIRSQKQSEIWQNMGVFPKDSENMKFPCSKGPSYPTSYQSWCSRACDRRRKEKRRWIFARPRYLSLHALPVSLYPIETRSRWIASLRSFRHLISDGGAVSRKRRSYKVVDLQFVALDKNDQTSEFRNHESYQDDW
jgi:hypothetical protein